VKVRHGEGVAIHTDPESCGARREARVEALTGECIGQPLSRESLLRGADAFETAEGHTNGGVSASRRPTPRGLRPGMCARALRGNREISWPATGRCRLVRIGKAWSRRR
jgi:hypothetical protein